MNNTEVVIIGGGLAGLYAASRLQQLNKNYLLFDVNHSVGGRINGIGFGDSKEESFDMGPSWIFPQHARMQALAKKYNVPLFNQYNQGDVLYQFEKIKEPQRRSGHSGTSVLRVKGGTKSLINKMVASLHSSSIYTQHKVIKVEKTGGVWRVTIKDKARIHKIKCLHVLMAIPPRVIARDFAEESWMTSFLRQELLACQTWMSSQAKLLVTYARPFWREMGLSGQAFSQPGPLVEVHDGCLSDEKGFALFGFIGIPAAQRVFEPVKNLKQACIRQLGVLFGQHAFKFEACHLKDWAKEPSICTGQDQSEGSRQPMIKTSVLSGSFAEQNLYFACSEFAEEEAGYLEGAIIAVENALTLFTSK